MNKEVLTNSEIYVMKAVWEADNDISISDLVTSLKENYGKEYARATVVTFLTRLELKGFIETVRRGRLAFVHAEITENDYKCMLAKRELEFWFAGSPAEYIAAYFSDKKPEKAQVKAIKEKLKLLAE